MSLLWNILFLFNSLKTVTYWVDVPSHFSLTYLSLLYFFMECIKFPEPHYFFSKFLIMSLIQVSLKHQLILDDRFINFISKRHRRGCFLANIAKFFKTLVLQNDCKANAFLIFSVFAISELVTRISVFFFSHKNPYIDQIQTKILWCFEIV